MTLDFISKDVREYMEQNGLSFTDFEKAALIHNFGLPVLERLELLQKLAEKTEDEVLKDQIREKIAVDQENLDAFRDNTEGYVYAVELEDEDGDRYCDAYFSTPARAFDYGMEKNEGRKFRIQKHLIIGYHGQEPKKGKGYRNPWLMKDATIEECVTESDSDRKMMAEASYSKDGVLQFFWSTEIERTDEEHLKRSYDPESYENAFIPFPNPFEMGDIVQVVGEKGPGIVSTSQLEWQKFLERVEAGLYVDFSDASIIVDFLQDNGTIMHGHICPVYLERYQPNKGDDDYNLLIAGQAVLRGQCDLDWFTHCYDYYKNLKMGIENKFGKGIYGN